MGETILDLLNNVQKDDTSNPNSRVLIIDGLNLYLRTFAVNGMLNDRGVPIGGMMGFLKSVAYAIRETNPTRLIVVYDGAGGSQRRRKLHPNYKGNRKPGKRITRWDAFKNVEEEKQAMKLKDEVIIMSADQDFLQLVNDRITVWSPIKKIFYTPEKVLEDYGVPAHNFLMYKVLMGDKSDNLEGVKGLGPKKLPKILPSISSTPLDLDFILDYASKGTEPMHKRITESANQLSLNETLMDLKNPPISGELKLQITRLIEAPINLLSSNDFNTMYTDDQMGNAIDIPDIWLKQHFTKLNSYAKATHE